jgi:transposase
MSLKATPFPSVPEETARVARAAFPKGAPWIDLRDELGPLYEDADFASLFPADGQPAEAPGRLILVIIFQFAEGLSDRQAADAVRRCIDWKYALSLSLEDEGFDESVLAEFRQRLIDGQADALILDKLLKLCRERKWIKARGRQRTDSTHVLAAIRSLNHLEHVGRTFQHALNTVAAMEPDWMRARLQDEWSEWPERYERRLDEYRLPKGESARAQMAVRSGLTDTPCSTLWKPIRIWRICATRLPSRRCGAFGCNSITPTPPGQSGASRKITAGRQAQRGLFLRTMWRRVTALSAR